MLVRAAKKHKGVFHFPGKKKERLVQIQKPAFHARVRFVQVKTRLLSVAKQLQLCPATLVLSIQPGYGLS